MPRMRIDKLGELGLNSDIPPAQLPPNAVTSLANVMTEDLTLRSAPGEVKLFDFDIAPLYHCTYIDPETQDQYIIISDGSDIYAYDMAGNDTDITPEGGWDGGRVTFTVLNGVLVVNSQTDGAFYWPDLESALAALPDWDSTWRCAWIASYRYYLVAGNFVENSTTYYPHLIRWSSSADPGAVPSEWEPSGSNDAGDVILGDSEGEIITSVLVRDSLWIVKEDAVYSLDWVGGQYIMQATKLTGMVGTRIYDGACKLGTGIALFGSNDIHFFDGNSASSLVDQRVRKELFAGRNIIEWRNSKLFSAYPLNWLLVAASMTGADARQKISYILDSNENTWGQKELNYAYGFDLGYVDYDATVPAWQDIATLWDQYQGSWKQGQYDPSERQILCYKSNPDNTAWWLELWTPFYSGDIAGNAITSQAERITIPVEGADGMAMITGVWPELTGDVSAVDFWISAQSAVGGQISYDGPYTITPNQTNYVTPRLTGRFVGWKLKCNQLGYWKLSSLTVNWERAGER